MNSVTNEDLAVIRAVWAELLELNDIRQDEDFFDLGGTSIAAVKTLARVGNRVIPMIDFTTFTREPTLEALVRAIRRRREQDQPAPT